MKSRTKKQKKVEIFRKKITICFWRKKISFALIAYRAHIWPGGLEKFRGAEKTSEKNVIFAKMGFFDTVKPL